MLYPLVFEAEGFILLTGTNLEYTKTFNRRIVLETIRLYGPTSRAEIARRTALTVQTVSVIVQELADRGLVARRGKVRGRRGQPAVEFTLNAKGAFTVGLNLDRDRLTGVLIDLTGEVQQHVHYSLTHLPGPSEATPLMHEAVHHLIKGQNLNRERLQGVGIGLPGPLDILNANAETMITHPNLADWDGIYVKEVFTKNLDLPVFIENNATAAAIGERWYGAGQMVSSFLYIFFGVGLGGGVILNGQSHRGFGGFAGELNDIPVNLDWNYGKPENVTRLGQYFSLANLYKELKSKGVTASSPADLEALYTKRDPCLIVWLDSAAQHLAPVLTTVENILDPEAIFFGGRLPNTLMDYLLEQLDHLLLQLRSKWKSYQPKLLRAQAGEDAAALGVATLPLYEAFAPHHQVLLKKNGEKSSPGRKGGELVPL